MNKLSKEKRSHLILVALVTTGIIAGLWFGLISAQQSKITDISRKSQSVQDEMDKEQKIILSAASVDAALKEATNRISKIEEQMPSGDLFSWIVASLKQFNVPAYKVDMPQVGVPSVGEVLMFPNFPYNQASVAVSGSAYYYDFGKFMADLENHFPYMRVQNLSLDPSLGSTAEEREKLYFHMELVSLVKPNNP